VNEEARISSWADEEKVRLLKRCREKLDDLQCWSLMLSDTEN